MAQAARIHDRLQASAMSQVDANLSPSLEACRQELAEIRTCLMLILGRDP